MMILSIIATVVLLGALFYHRVSLFLSSLILLAWTAALGVAGLWSIWLLVPLAIILVPFKPHTDAKINDFRTGVPRLP
ncbi:acyl-CoA dehydrogenase [Salmonella enterica subsp. enterica serovar Virchow str. ATCC 51955]|nr:acyl-CoA dehydrogenase [Salmonella enterica subsp. enterica serovar Virchow str. ATCC 51955]